MLFKLYQKCTNKNLCTTHLIVSGKTEDTFNIFFRGIEKLYGLPTTCALLANDKLKKFGYEKAALSGSSSALKVTSFDKIPLPLFLNHIGFLIQGWVLS